MNNKFLYKIIIILVLISQSVLAEIKKLEEFKIIPHEDLYKSKDIDNFIFYGIAKDGKMSRGISFYMSDKYPDVSIWIFTTREKLLKYGAYFHKFYSVTVNRHFKIKYDLTYKEFPENEDFKDYPDQVNSNDDLEKIIELIKYDIDLPYDLNKDYGINIPEITEQKKFFEYLHRAVEIQEIKFYYNFNKPEKYILKRTEMKRNCDSMWFNRKLAGTMTDQQIIDMCIPMGYDVISKTWKYEPKSIKKVLRKYGVND